MSRRVLSVLSIAVALALLALGWRAFAPADSGAPPTRPAVDGGSAASALPGGESPGIADAAAGAVRSNAGATATSHRLLCIVDESGAPVADAEVAFDLSAELIQQWQPFAFDVEARLTAAPRYRTSTDGIVALPTDSASAFVIARAGEHFGYAAIEFDCGLYDVPEFTIAPDRTLRIAVVSPRGEARPDVPVEAVYESEQPLDGECTSTRLLPRTDANGMTTLWHAQMLSFWDRATAAIDLHSLVLGATPPTVHVALTAPAPERIALECPDHGSLLVRTWLAAGLRNRAHDPPQVEDVDGTWDTRDWLVQRTASPGEWRALPVALGRRLRVSAPGLQWTEPVSGPTRHGDEVVVDLDRGVPAFTALLLQPDGQPCRNQPILVDCGSRIVAETDADGRLACAQGFAPFPLVLTAPDLHAHATFSEDPGTTTSNGFTDLGVVRLLPMQLLATGHVVDAITRRPLSSYVRAMGAPGEDGDRPSIAHGPARADGRFELWGEGSGALHLETQKTGYGRTSADVAVGARDVVLALQPMRRLRATVLVDPDVAIENLSVRVRAGEDTPGWRTARIERGRFHALFELPDGDDLVLEVRGCDEMPMVAQVPMREWLAADGVFATTVDLRGKLANVLVTVTTANGGDHEGSLYVRPTGRSARWASLDLARRVVFAVPNGTTLDAIVRPDAGACIRTTLRPGENTIEVPPPAVAQIEVAGLPPGVARTAIGVRIFRLARREPLLDELVTAGLDVDPGEGLPPQPSLADLEQQETGHGWQVFGEGPARFELPRRGSYLAVPYVVASDRRVPLLYSEIVIEIRTPGETVPMTIRLDPEKVRAALK